MTTKQVEKLKKAWMARWAAVWGPAFARLRAPTTHAACEERAAEEGVAWEKYQAAVKELEGVKDEKQDGD